MFGANSRSVVYLEILIWGFLTGCCVFLWRSEVGVPF